MASTQRRAQPVRSRWASAAGRAVTIGSLLLSLLLGPTPQFEYSALGSSDSARPMVAHLPGAKPLRKWNGKNHPKLSMRRTGMWSLEPTVGVTRNGSIFMSAFRGNDQIDVARSRDEGLTWEASSPNLGGQNTHRLSFDPYVYVDEATDRVFTIDLTVACSYLSFSDDEGETWTTNPLACGRPVNDHQTLFSGPPVSSGPQGYANLVYYCYNAALTSECSKSTDGGLTFVPTGESAFGLSEACGGVHGHGVVGPRGTVYLPKSNCGEPWLAISHDEGATWNRVLIAGNGVRGDSPDPSVAVDRRSNVYFAWIAADRLPYLAVSRDGGLSWSKPLMVAAPGVTAANLATIDAGRPGAVSLAYMGTLDREAAVLSGEARWGGYVAFTTQALRSRPVFFSGSINDSRDPLIIGECLSRCGALYDFLDVAISPSGRVFGAFVDACTSTTCAETGEGVVGVVTGGSPLN